MYISVTRHYDYEHDGEVCGGASSTKARAVLKGPPSNQEIILLEIGFFHAVQTELPPNALKIIEGFQVREKTSLSH